ncbi:MAG: glutathione S-transferase, partial [Polyangiaceae bacterium]|nr:glutathione S-transferase [Polyangiaceae bacterium]
MLRLVVANLNYSSWSMRAWLGLKRSGAAFKVFDVGLKTQDGWKERILQFSGAGKVPVLIDGASSIHESLAILETVHEKFPAAGLWPKDPALRARGRAISTEMASSFFALREQMPTTLRGRARQRPQGKTLDEDIQRVLEILDASLSSSKGEFLLGELSIA